MFWISGGVGRRLALTGLKRRTNPSFLFQDLKGKRILLPEIVDSEPSRQELIIELDRHFSSRGIRRRRRSHIWRSKFWTSFLRVLGFLERLGASALAAGLLTLSAPLLLVLFFWAKARGGHLGSRPVLGRWAIPFPCFQFEFTDPQRAPFWAKTPLMRLPALVNAVRGDMSFIGPRPVSPNELPASERSAWKRYDIRPGFVSLWWLRQRGNIAYAREAEMDAEYVNTKSFMGDLGIALRAIPALAYGSGVGEAPDKVTLLGIPIVNLSMAEATEQIIELAASGRANQVCFVNADCANIAFNRQSYNRILKSCRMVLADGIGVRLAGKILNQHIRENVNGTDLLPLLCAAAAKNGMGLYLLGGRPGVPEAAADWIRQRHPGITICGTRHGYFTPSEEPEVISAIRNSGAAILLVAFGVPKQDEWIEANRKALGAGVCIGVGGLFDFYSGRIARAPVWMREIGMEWFYRFMQEPGRMWRRYFLGNAMFLYRVLNERRRANYFKGDADAA